MRTTEVVIIAGPISEKFSYPDNRTGPCHRCKTEVVWRPHAPEPSIKLCLDCAVAVLPKDAVLTITEKTLQEVREHDAGRKGVN